MAVFHIYTLVARRKYDSVFASQFQTDDEAVRFAQAFLADHYAVEVWAGDRLVFQATAKSNPDLRLIHCCAHG